MGAAAQINGKYVTSVTVGPGGQITIPYGNQATAITVQSHDPHPIHGCE